MTYRRNKYYSKHMQLEILTLERSNRGAHFTAFENNFQKIATHDHSENQGKRVTPAGLRFTDDLTLNSYGLYSVGAAEFGHTVDTPLRSIKVESGDFFVIDGAGNSIQLTEDGSFVGVGFDAISGDYADSQAIVGYNSNTKSYYLKSNSNEYAHAAFGTLWLTNTGGVSADISFNSASTYDIKLPAVSPERPSVLVSDAGRLSFEATSTTQVNLIQLYADGTIDCAPLQLRGFPTADGFQGFHYGVGGDAQPVGSDAVKLPYNDTPLDSNTPSGAFKINSVTGTLDTYNTTVKKSISINAAGLSLNDPVDCSIEGVLADGELWTKVEGTWLNTTSLPVAWDAVVNAPTDVTDLTTHSINEFANVYAATPQEGDVLKADASGNFVASPDEGRGAIWANVTGTLADQTDLNNLLGSYMRLDAYHSSDSILSDLSDVEAGATDNQILVTDASGNLVPTDNAGGAVSPITSKGGLWFAVDNVPTNGELTPGADGTVLLYRDNTLKWTTTEGLTGGGGAFLAAVVDTTSSRVLFTSPKTAAVVISVDNKQLLDGSVSITVGGEQTDVEAYRDNRWTVVLQTGDTISLDASILIGISYVTLLST